MQTTLRTWWRKGLGGFMACLGLVGVQVLQEEEEVVEMEEVVDISLGF